MSLTRVVPAVVPSLFHSSVPVSLPPALKYKLPFMLNSADALLFSCFTMVVPAVVPSLFHKFCPPKPRALSARKNSVPLTLVRLEIEKPLICGSKSLTTVVPAVVPSVFQSWRILEKVLALK